MYDSPPVAATPTPRRYASPPGDHLNHLIELARTGDIAGLQQKANHLEQLDPSYQPLATELKRLAKTFQIKKIRKLLEEIKSRL